MRPISLFLVLTCLLGIPADSFGADPLKERCREAAVHYAELVHATYADSVKGAKELQAALERFAENSNEENLELAKVAWIESRIPYLQSEAFRFYAGPIDDEDGPEPLINGWPLDEFYIDYVEGAPEAGIINDVRNYPEITAELIRTHNEKAGETAITCGYHAIEFLLWGQDQSDDGPGARPVSDFTTAPNADRRRAYLLACGALLVTHLQELVDEWKPDSSTNFRSEFLSEDPRRAIWYAAYGMRTLSGKELAGERLLVAWDTQAQEDEHSCFSDTTHRDVQLDALGLKNVFTGRYRRSDGRVIEGPGLETVLKQFDAKAAVDLGETIDAAIEAAERIPAPFDQAILGDDTSTGRMRILECVERLEDQAALLGKFEQQLIAALRSGEEP